jgi:protein-histidine N-methyltransferase
MAERLSFTAGEGKEGCLWKRNLKDIVLQVAREDIGDQNVLSNVFTGHSDLVPMVYEGGLKTWEGAMDLVGFLTHLDRDSFKGIRVLEVTQHIILLFELMLYR